MVNPYASDLADGTQMEEGNRNEVGKRNKVLEMQNGNSNRNRKIPRCYMKHVDA